MSDESPRHPSHDDGEPLREGEEHAPPGVRAMAIVRWAIVGLMALAAVGSVLYYFDKLPRAGAAAKTRYYCPMHPSIVQDQPGDCPICGMSLVPANTSGGGAAEHQHGDKGGAKKPEKKKPETKTRYSCPMHPQIVQDQKGQCPICGMDLVPTQVQSQPEKEKSAAESGKRIYVCPMHPDQTSTDPNARCPVCKMRLEPQAGAGKEEKVPGVVPVDIPPERVQLIGMRTAKVTRQTLTGELRTVGYVTTSERGMATITTRFAGWIEKLHVNQTGVRVARGQVLATVYSPQLLQAQQELLAARRWRGAGGADPAGSGTMEDDAQRRLELLGISRQEIAEVLKSGQPLRALKIRAPVSGHVTQKSAFAGAYVQPGTTLFELADLTTVWAVAAVYEHEIGRVRVGQSARFEVAAYPGKDFAGTVQFVYPTLDATTRTLRVRLVLPNKELQLKPGMYGTARLQLERAEGLVVPKEAVVDTGEVQYVFLSLDGGRFRPRKVKLGARADDKVQVLSGLAEGETVVTTGNFLIDSESRLRAAIQGLGGAHEGHSK